MSYIGPGSAAKVFGVIYAVMSVVFLLPLGLLVVLAGNGPRGMTYLLMALIYPLAGLIGGAIGAVLYNVAAKYVGGIEIELDRGNAGSVEPWAAGRPETSDDVF